MIALWPWDRCHGKWLDMIFICLISLLFPSQYWLLVHQKLCSKRISLYSIWSFEINKWWGTARFEYLIPSVHVLSSAIPETTLKFMSKSIETLAKIREAYNEWKKSRNKVVPENRVNVRTCVGINKLTNSAFYLVYITQALCWRENPIAIDPPCDNIQTQAHVFSFWYTIVHKSYVWCDE